ncbi:hypothetical protein Trydic_g466 [Trypoxylus dichotomus]
MTMDPYDICNCAFIMVPIYYTNFAELEVTFGRLRAIDKYGSESARIAHHSIRRSTLVLTASHKNLLQTSVKILYIEKTWITSKVSKNTSLPIGERKHIKMKPIFEWKSKKKAMNIMR